MKVTLLTYDSVLVCNAGYIGNSKAVEFSDILKAKAIEFSTYAGIDWNSIYWQEVTDSDWCKNTIVLYAGVAADWKPTEETVVYDESFDPNWYSNLARDFNSFIRGRGSCVDIKQHPPKSPHSLFKTINNQLR